MYMRYAGGGVGHYKVKLDDFQDSGLETTEDMQENEEDVLVGLQQAMLEIDEENASDSSSDSGRSSEGEGVDEDNLPEDGEGGFVDAEDEEGFAEL